MIKTAGKLEKMAFIQDNEPGVLIAEYYLFYLERCEIFSKSHHIFDEEPTVEKKLSNIQLYEDGKSLNNWQFVKSHENIYIQVSDMVAGLLRKLFMFLDENSMEKIHSISLSLNEIQIANGGPFSFIPYGRTTYRKLCRSFNTCLGCCLCHFANNIGYTMSSFLSVKNDPMK